MKHKLFFLILFAVFSTCLVHVSAQQKSGLKIKKEKRTVRTKKKRRPQPYNPLAPARAAFYSTILPGLGQIYTKKYWKLPIVYGAIGAGIYAFVWNNRQYHRFRDVYKTRLAGLPDADSRFSIFSNDRLIDLQRRYRRDQEFALLITIALYALNVIDANVSAHLKQYTVSDDLSFAPKIDFLPTENKPILGASIQYFF